MTRARVEIRRWPARVVGVLAGALAVGTASASITGVCPDGSMFIVQRPETIPCPEAKAVDPSELPPIRPHYLPRPYGWEIFNRRNDPNNPYNLIQKSVSDPSKANAGRDEPRHVSRREPLEAADPVEEQRVEPRAELRDGGAGATAAAQRGAGLALGDAELRDLALIVELSQQRAPAEVYSAGDGARVRLARSAAFEARLRDSLASRGQQIEGPVLLFSVGGRKGEAFYGNLTFVQGHIAYQPNAHDPLQLGVIRGSLGPLADGPEVLGYVVLPARLDLARPLDVYWNDRQVTATLAPPVQAGAAK